VYIPRAVRALSAKWPLSICSVDQCGPSCWSVSVRIRSSDADHLGYAGRRVLVSRKWSGKTLADHRADRKEWLLRTLGISATDPARYTWEAVCVGDNSGRQAAPEVGLWKTLQDVHGKWLKLHEGAAVGQCRPARRPWRNTWPTGFAR
jgi:hypothetical protein